MGFKTVGYGGKSIQTLSPPRSVSRGRRKPRKKNNKKTARDTKFAPPSGGSKTITKKPYRKGAVIHDSNIGGSMSFCTMKKRFPLKKGLKKVGQKNYDSIDGTARLSGAVGRQLTYVPFKTADVSELTRLFTHINSNIATQMLLEYATASLKFQNGSNAMCEIVIYDIVSKNDLAKTAPTDYTFADAAWQQGIIDEGSATTDYKVVGQTPFASKFFCEFYNVKQVTKIHLNPGAMHEHKIKYRCNEWINKARYWWASDANFDSYNIRKLTYQPLVVVNGGIANDSITKTQISYVAPNVNLIFKQTYTYTWFADNNTNYYNTTTVPTSFGSNPVIENESGSSAVAYAAT